MGFQTLVRSPILEIEKVGAWANVGDQRHDEFFTNRVDRRIGDLSEGLLEIVIKHA